VIMEPGISTSASSRPDRQRPGRSAPRSRNGCLMCKQRRVRCDETRPVCAHCTRLDLECVYRKRPLRGQRALRSGSLGSPTNDRISLNDTSQNRGPSDAQPLASLINGDANVGRARETPSHSFREESNRQSSITNTPHRASFPITPGSSTTSVSQIENQRTSRTYLRDPCEGFYDWPNQVAAENHYNFSLDRTFDPPNGQDSLGSFTFSDVQLNGASWDQFPANSILQTDRNGNATIQGSAGNAWSLSIDSLLEASLQDAGPQSRIPVPRVENESIDFSPGSDYMGSKRSTFLLYYFSKISQPPASLLITGVGKWRRLQNYFTKLSHQHRAVASALFAIIELLAKDDQSVERADTLDSLNFMGPALKLQDSARKEIELVMSKEWQNCPTTRDALLASIFLLAWFEVVRDQVFDQRLFPGELADQIITSSGKWNRYSVQLLQWFNTLDSKATHLGGQHLLSQKALQVVSEHHTQINAAGGSSEEQSDEEQSPESAVSPGEHISSVNRTISTPSIYRDNAPSPLVVHNNNFKSIGQMKTVLLNTILQPALDWYLSTQRYCRHISSHDRHHRSRFTVKDEYEVVIACKKLEVELMHLWRQRPQIIRLTITQLREIVSADIAARLEAIFSLYMASFWILFVYLHRVVWWHLPHSETTEIALEETWQNLQRSFGEVVEGEKKVVHPALLWPLFMFGSECNNESRRDWAVEQLMALGNANTIVGHDDEGESLPPFRLSLGATRNAKRAAILLRELISRQTVRKSRVDDKELSLELFGCHFSII
jgi:hypothetical protein